MNLDERYNSIQVLHVKIKILIHTSDHNNGDFDLLVDDIQQLVINNDVKLLDEEVRYLADIYFKLEKSTDRTKQNQRLDNANRLYQEIDHANNMILKQIISGAEVRIRRKGIIVSNLKSLPPQLDQVGLQCDVWQKLILKSIEDLGDRKIRIAILEHPFNCQHPTCIQVATHMKGILK